MQVEQAQSAIRSGCDNVLEVQVRMGNAARVERTRYFAKLSHNGVTPDRAFFVLTPEQTTSKFFERNAFNGARDKKRLPRQTQTRLLCQKQRLDRGYAAFLQRGYGLPFAIRARPAETREQRVPIASEPVPFGIDEFTGNLECKDRPDGIGLYNPSAAVFPGTQRQQPVNEFHRRIGPKPPFKACLSVNV